MSRFLEDYFADRVLNQTAFDNAIAGAKAELAPLMAQYRGLGWDCCVGASGTVQALQEIMVTQGMDEVISLEKLHRLRDQAIACGQMDALDIEGLTLERALVFPSGLSILIAIFECLDVTRMTLAGGALREGLVYEMMTAMRHSDIRARTIASIQSRYQLDELTGSMWQPLHLNCFTSVRRHGYRSRKHGACSMLQPAYMKSG